MALFMVPVYGNMMLSRWHCLCTNIWSYNAQYKYMVIWCSVDGAVYVPIYDHMMLSTTVYDTSIW